MFSRYSGKAIAGSGSVSYGYEIVSETVKKHYSTICTTTNPEFVELLAVEVMPRFGFNPDLPVNLTFKRQC